MIKKVFGDHLHNNDGSQLIYDTTDDHLWQKYYKSLIPYNPQQFHLPRGAVGSRFLRIVSTLLDGIISRRHNSEKFLVFILVTLQRVSTKKPNNKLVRDTLSNRMDNWEAGLFGLLVTNCKRGMKNFLIAHRRSSTSADRARHYNRLLLQGELRRAV